MSKINIYIYIYIGVSVKHLGIPKVPIRDTYSNFAVRRNLYAQTVVRRAILYPYIGCERQPLCLAVLSRDTDGSDTKWG